MHPGEAEFCYGIGNERSLCPPAMKKEISTAEHPETAEQTNLSAGMLE
jgi:hypothetical protein